MSLDDDMAAALEGFVIEARELLQEMEEGLLGLEAEGAHAADLGEVVNAIFRAAHTIKGSSGLFGLDHIVRFTHVVESVLDRVRDGSVDISTELVGALLPCRDHLSLLIDGVDAGELSDTGEYTETAATLLARLQPFLDGGGSSGDAPGAGTVGPGSAPVAARRDLRLSLRFSIDCLRNGMDPLAFIRYLSTLGEVTALVTDTSRMPDAEQMDAESCYLGFEAVLHTDADIESVEGVFEFVRDDSEIVVREADDVTPPAASSASSRTARWPTPRPSDRPPTPHPPPPPSPRRPPQNPRRQPSPSSAAPPTLPAPRHAPSGSRPRGWTP